MPHTSSHHHASSPNPLFPFHPYNRRRAGSAAASAAPTAATASRPAAPPPSGRPAKSAPRRARLRASLTTRSRRPRHLPPNPSRRRRLPTSCAVAMPESSRATSAARYACLSLRHSRRSFRALACRNVGVLKGVRGGDDVHHAPIFSGSYTLFMACAMANDFFPAALAIFACSGRLFHTKP